MEHDAWLDQAGALLGKRWPPRPGGGSAVYFPRQEKRKKRESREKEYCIEVMVYIYTVRVWMFYLKVLSILWPN